MHPDQEKAVFNYLDLLGFLWQKHISTEDLSIAEASLPAVLADLEALLPS